MFISNFIRFFFRTGKSCYPQVLLEESKYVVEKKKIPKYIIGDAETSSDSDSFSVSIKMINKYYRNNQRKDLKRSP